MRFISAKIFTLFFLMLSLSSFAQLTKIRGNVKDAQTGEPIPFVNIYFLGTTQGVMSDFKGNFFIESKSHTDTLVASFLGFEPQKIFVQKGIFQNIYFELKQNSIYLSEVIIKPKENPAEIILKKIIARKPFNNPDKYQALQYELYSKIQIDINNIGDEFKEKRNLKDFQFLYNYVDTSTVNGKTYLPIFLSESLSDVYTREGPKGYVEIVKASKISGIKNQSVSQLMSDEFLSLHLYDNYIALFQKNFVSPIADFGLSFYKYYLVDSACVDNKWCYNIMYKPKQKQTLTFTGNFWVNDTSFAVKQIEMRIADDANINYVNDFYIKKDYDFINGYWVLSRDYSVGDLNIFEKDNKTMGFFGHKTTTYRNYVINKPKETPFYANAIDVIVLDSALNRGSDFWEKKRHEDLNKDEKTVYFIVDTLQTIPRFNTYTDIVKMIVTGYYVKDKIEIGPYASMLSFNSIEGVRLRFGGRTSNKFSNKLMLNGYAAYGLADKQVKSGAGFIYVFNKNLRRTLNGSFKFDLEQLGQSQNSFREDFLLAFLFRRQPADKLSTVKEYTLSYENEWFPGFMSTFTVLNRQIFPIGKTEFNLKNYFNNSYSIINEGSIVTTELRLNLRLALKERYTIGDFERTSLSAKYPIINIQYGYGFPNLLNSDYEYHNLSFNVSHWFNVLNLGWSKFIIDGGRIWGTLPYPLLKLHEGNETFVFDEYSYNMMNYYEFVSDKYLSVYYTHHFDGYFANRVPLFRKLKWREVFYVKGLVGGLDKSNRNYSVFPQGMYRLDKPYFETGAGLENIFKIIRVDAVWRLSHLDHAHTSPLGFRFGLNFNF